MPSDHNATITRRALLKGTTAATSLAAGPTFAAGPRVVPERRPTDVTIKEVRFAFEDHLYRTPLKFHGTVVDRVTLLNVNVTIAATNGKAARGFGSMPLGNVWSFPSRPYAETLHAMKELTGRIAQITRDHKGAGHPVDLNVTLEPAYFAAAAELSKTLALKEAIPKLCTLTAASPFDAAIHDAYGKLHGRSAYATYGREFMQHDLSRYLGPEFKGETLGQYILAAPKAHMPLYHLVGAVDAITEADLKARIGDGLPETLPDWINFSGVTHIKVKLNGDDLAWDVDRVVRVHKATTAAQTRRGVSAWNYSLDFNERCKNVEYLLEFLRRLKEQANEAVARVQYIEQPTDRDLRKQPKNLMHAAAKIVPVVIDESLTDLESMILAREMGYSGVALKACKGQTQALLMAAAAQKHRMFLCVQDLTCPGASLIHSAGLAAHIPGVAAIEANARQYVPTANKGWDQKFPGVFDVRDGRVATVHLDGPGLGAVRG